MLSLFLTQAGVGSLLVMLMVPPRAAGRKFFQYTVAQSTTLLVLGGALVVAGPGPWPNSVMIMGAAVLLLIISAGLFHQGRLGAGQGFLIAGFVLAAAGSVLDALALVPGGDTSLLSLLLYPLDAVTAGLLLGSVLIAMILGHYYLNIPGLSIGYLQRLAVVFMVAVAARLVVASITLVRNAEQLRPLVGVLLDTEGLPVPEGTLDPFVLVFLLVHLAVGILGAGVLAVMTWRTTLISATQSATGILYVALILVIMGELASRYMLTLTGLPF